MSIDYFLRFGAFGEVGRFRGAEPFSLRRGERVVTRTPRGVELAEVLRQAASNGEAGSLAGTIVRPLSQEDALVETRLERARREAFDACATRLRELESGVSLLEIEHLFDGRTLIFHFLGETAAPAHEVASELAQVYDGESKFSQFAASLTEGCGPECGTEAAAGSGCGDCASGCAVAAVCHTSRPRA